MRPLRLLLVLLAALSTAALADTPARISEDYQKQAAAALGRLNETLERATTPLIASLVKAGDTAAAEQLTAQLKAKLAGGPVPTPQASATLLFAQYDQARARALEPAQKAALARIDAMLSGPAAPRLETITELGRVRAEISGSPVADATAGAAAATVPAASSSSPPATGKVADFVTKLGGKFTEGSEGDGVDFVRANLTPADLQQICTDKRLRAFSWNTGRGLTDEGLAAFAGMKNLEELFLWGTGSITDAGLEHLAGCEKLKLVNFGSNGSGVTGSSFEALAQCKKLQRMTLNYLTGLKGENLRHLIKLKSLEVLLLSNCKEVKDADLEWVAQISSLTHLHLGRTGVTDAGLPKLLPLKKLEELTVSEPVTPEGVKVLTKAHPKLKIVFAK